MSRKRIDCLFLLCYIVFVVSRNPGKGNFKKMKEKIMINIGTSIEKICDQEEEILKTLQDLKDLMPDLIQLNEKAKSRLAKLSRKRWEFVLHTHLYAEQNPELLPAYMDINHYQRTLQAIETLNRIQAALLPICNMVKDTLMQVRSEAYQAALLFYRSVKDALLFNIPHAEEACNDLAYHFKRRNRNNQGIPSPE